VASELSGDAPRSREGRADHSGLARLPSLPPGRWSLSVRVGDEQQSPGREVEVRAGELTSLEIALP
jgi:hypothetical protein